MNNRIISTRGGDNATIEEAIMQGLAKDGGLYIPQIFPEYSLKDFSADQQLSDFAYYLLSPFFINTPIFMSVDFCKKVFSFPLNLHHLTEKSYCLELFHGPTLSFKDFGACFFAQCLEVLAKDNKIDVLVATSGDTGSAVASALHRKSNVKGFILFPKDKISSRQQAQISCWGDNIRAIAVHGNFDQCQQLVKMAFAQVEKNINLTTANSINIARLLPQMLFYAYSSMQIIKKHQQPANYIVPSGNLGNVTACYWAKSLGFPIEHILIANNANQVLHEYLISGRYQAKPSIKTLANAMDVGDPSNLERLIAMYSDFADFKTHMNVSSVSDDDIKEGIIDCYRKYNYLICPHTATAYHRLKEQDVTKPWVILATAHPAKFYEIIEPLLNLQIELPERLHDMLHKKQHIIEIEPNIKELLNAMMN